MVTRRLPGRPGHPPQEVAVARVVSNAVEAGGHFDPRQQGRMIYARLFERIRAIMYASDQTVERPRDRHWDGRSHRSEPVPFSQTLTDFHRVSRAASPDRQLTATVIGDAVAASACLDPTATVLSISTRDFPAAQERRKGGCRSPAGR